VPKVHVDINFLSEGPQSLGGILGVILIEYLDCKILALRISGELDFGRYSKA